MEIARIDSIQCKLHALKNDISMQRVTEKLKLKDFEDRFLRSTEELQSEVGGEIYDKIEAKEIVDAENALRAHERIVEAYSYLLGQGVKSIINGGQKKPSKRLSRKAMKLKECFEKCPPIQRKERNGDQILAPRTRRPSLEEQNLHLSNQIADINTKWETLKTSVLSGEGTINRKIIAIHGSSMAGTTSIAYTIVREMKDKFDCSILVNTGTNPTTNDILMKIAKEVTSEEEYMNISDTTGDLSRNLIRIVKNNLPEKFLLVWNHVPNQITWSVLDEVLGRVDFFLPTLDFSGINGHLQNCFFNCVLMPENDTITRKQITWFWIAECFISHDDPVELEKIAEGYINQLVKCSLLVWTGTGNETLQMHGMLRACCIDTLYRNKFALICPLTNSEKLNKITRICIWSDGGSLQVNDKLEKKGLHSFLSFDKNLPEKWIKDVEKFKLLRVLCLRFCKFGKKMVVLDNMFNLHYLDMSDTDITKVPGTIKNLLRLNRLDLTRTRIKKLSCVKMPKSLRHLHLPRRNDPNNHFDGVLVEVESNISCLTNLETLENAQACKKIVRRLEGSSIKELSLTNVMPHNFADILDSLTKMKSLKTLNIVLEKNEIRKTGLFHKLTFSGSRTQIGKKDLTFSAESLSGLEKLYLVGADSEVDSVEILAEALARVTYLELDGLNELKKMPGISVLANVKQIHLKNMSDDSVMTVKDTIKNDTTLATFLQGKFYVDGQRYNSPL